MVIYLYLCCKEEQRNESLFVWGRDKNRNRNGFNRYHQREKENEKERACVWEWEWSQNAMRSKSARVSFVSDLHHFHSYLFNSRESRWLVFSTEVQTQTQPSGSASTMYVCISRKLGPPPTLRQLAFCIVFLDTGQLPWPFGTRLVTLRLNCTLLVTSVHQFTSGNMLMGKSMYVNHSF
jgi:hypothetical protein